MEPRLGVEVLACRADVEPGRWQVGWNVHNSGATAVELQAAWIPHGRFRGDGRLPLSIHVEVGATARLEFGVRAQEEPGTRVDNAFLILRISADNKQWRVFTRMHVEFDPQGHPKPIVEAVTWQPIAEG